MWPIILVQSHCQGADALAGHDWDQLFRPLDPDRDSNRVSLVHPDATEFRYSYDGLDRVNDIRLGASTSLVGATYRNNGRLNTLSRAAGAGATTVNTYDTIQRLNTQVQNLAATAYDLTNTFSYNPASQVTQRVLSNSQYAHAGSEGDTGAYAVNGLNQYTSVAGAAYAHDANGNLTSDGSTTLVYDIENRLVTLSGAKSGTLAYDPHGRLWKTLVAGVETRFVYDGDALVSELNASNTVLRRYVHGNMVDTPKVWFEGSAASAGAARYFHPDHQGSVIAVSGNTGSIIGSPVTYSAFGVPSASATHRFTYTGQVNLQGLDLYYYKARIYDPGIGRFLQVDPVGYQDQMNLYAYVANDPVNGIDPTGMIKLEKPEPEPIRVYDQVDTTQNQDGSATVERNQIADNGIAQDGSVTARGTVTRLPQDTAGGAPAPISDDMQNNLLDLSESIGNQTVEVTSGFRSQAAQDAIRAAGNPRAAQRSSHTYNDAADIRVQGMTPDALADAADSTGNFARSNTYGNGGDVHVDQNSTATYQGRVCDYGPC